jgi:hypothetical protein
LKLTLHQGSYCKSLPGRASSAEGFKADIAAGVLTRNHCLGEQDQLKDLKLTLQQGFLLEITVWVGKISGRI